MEFGEGPRAAAELPKRLLFVFRRYAMGGFEAWLDTLIECLHRRCIEICCAGGQDFNRSPMRGLVRDWVPLGLTPFTGENVARSARRIAQLVDEAGVQIVHLHPYGPLLPGALGSMLAGVPYVCTFHGRPDGPAIGASRGAFFKEGLSQFVLPNAASVGCVSELVADGVAEFFGFPREKLVILGNPVRMGSPREVLPAQPGVKTALLVSRLDDDKRFSVRAGLELMRQLKLTGGAWRFRVAGAGGMADDVRARARKLGLEDTQFLGARSDVDALMRESDVVIGIGRVVLEGLAAECTTVVAGRSGLVGVVTPDNFDVLDRQNFNGFGMAKADPELVAREAVAALARPADRAGALRAVVEERHGAERIADAHLAWYTSARRAERVPERLPERVLRWLDHAASASLVHPPASGAFLEWRENPCVAGPAASGAGSRDERQAFLEALEDAEELQRRTLGGCREFRASLEARLLAYRSERAWKVMLWIRKAYTILHRGPVLKTLPLLLRFAWRTASGGDLELDEVQPAFPDLPHYLPARAAAAVRGLPEPEPPRSPAAKLYGLPPARKHDVIVLAGTEFDARSGGSGEPADRWAAAGHRVFWVSPGQRLPANFSSPFELVPLRGNLWMVRLRAEPLDGLRGSLDPETVAACAAGLMDLHGECNLTRTVVFVESPCWREVAQALDSALGSAAFFPASPTGEAAGAPRQSA